MVGIIEKACRAAVIHQIPGITRCLVTPPDKLDPKTYFTTEGQNLKATWNFGAGKLDLNQIYSNDIAAILRTYGVEAARMALIREISAVFGVYGIGVDRRHLTLIADYMVCSRFLSRITADSPGRPQKAATNLSIDPVWVQATLPS